MATFSSMEDVLEACGLRHLTATLAAQEVDLGLLQGDILTVADLTEVMSAADAQQLLDVARGAAPPKSASKGDRSAAAPSEEGSTGAVIWFAKGHGFIKPDDGGPDIFVHASEVGTGRLEEGDAVTFAVEASEKGLKAVAVHVVAKGPAPTSRRDARRRGPEAEATRDLLSGKVMWFNKTKNMGFVRPSDAPDPASKLYDVFVHGSDVPGRTLKQGDVVSYYLVKHNDKDKAVVVGRPKERA